MGKQQKDEAFYKKLWSLMVPIVLQNLMLAMVAVADVSGPMLQQQTQ